MSEGEHGPAIIITLVFTQSVTGLMSPWERTEEVGPRRIPPRLYPSVCVRLSLSGHVMGNDDNTGRGWLRAVQRPHSIGNLPGHLAWLTLFKQVPRRLVSCLVKWLTFWFNQHPRLPDELDHYQKCTGCAMSLTCQNPTHLLIYLLHSSWSIVAVCRLKVACPWCVVKLGWAPETSIIWSPTHIILKTHNGGPEKKNKHSIPSASLLNIIGCNLFSVEDKSISMF